MIKLVNNLSRYIVALVFIFSGFVKMVDPYGTAYKIGDYVETVGINLPLWLVLILSVAQSLGEFMLGMNALFKVYYRNTTKWLLGVMVFFFFVTLYIAIFDPVQDCGCFGDALVISNWATFFKNVVLLVLTWGMYRNRNYLRKRLYGNAQLLMTVGFVAFSVLVSINAIRHLPFLDFRPYAVGTYIPEKMHIPADAPQDEYATTFIYEKDSVQQEFTEENYPWQDTTWSYVSSETKLVKKGYEPPIHDFAFANDELGDFTQEVLADPNYTFMLVTPDVEKTSLRHKENIESVMQYCEENNYRFLLLTASLGEELNAFMQSFDGEMTVCNMDDITLKTIVRAYPGLVIIKDGTVLAKYHHRDLPEFTAEQTPLSQILSANMKHRNQIIILLLSLVLGAFSVKLSMTKKIIK